MHPSVARTGQWTILAITSLVLLSGCASVPPPEQDTRDFRARAEHRQAGDLRVPVSVLGAAESEAQFEASLAHKNIQPVWLEVTNSGPQEFILMLLSMDPDYFSPSEVAWQARDPEE